MKFAKKNIKLIISTFSIILIIFLSIFGFLEYKWFSKIAENEFFKTYNSLILNFNRVSGREFDRITIFTSWLNNYKEDENTDKLENFISNIYEEYSNGDNASIISSIGYITLDENSSVENMFDGNTWSIKPVREDVLEKIKNSEEKQNYFFDNENLTITVSINETSYFIVNFNLVEFTNSLLLPSISEANKEVDIQWVSQSNKTYVNQNYHNLFKKSYSYNFTPVISLIKGPYISNQVLVVPLAKQELFKLNNQESHNEKESSVLDKMIRPNNNNAERTLLNEDEIYAYIGIKINRDEFYGTYIEKTLSLIFIGGIILISLIGLICILLLYQLIRIQRQRNKEREFTASITHELRTPLTVIQSASDNLCENLVKPQKVPSYGKLIKQQSTRLNSMIENMLVYSKIEGNKFYNRIENKVNLKQFFELLKIQTSDLAKEKGIEIQWIFKNLEDKVVLIDRRLLELVFSNLISNSLFHAYNKYSGVIRVKVKFNQPNNTIFAIIEDDGIGIPIKEQKYIWDSYFRGENSINSQERGSGLGLFIVKKNITILGGKISLTSPYKRLDGSVKNGCHFECKIPCKVVKK